MLRTSSARAARTAARCRPGRLRRRARRRARLGADHAHDGGAGRRDLGARRPRARRPVPAGDRAGLGLLDRASARVRAASGLAWLPSPPTSAGSSPVEFVLVGTLLTLLTLGVLQFGLAVYVRNVVHDAAVEGAYHAALADTSLADGADRTREIVSRTVGAEYAADVERAGRSSALGQPAVRRRRCARRCRSSGCSACRGCWR